MVWANLIDWTWFLKEVFEAFKVPPKRFTRFLLGLHDVFPNESGLVDWIEFLQEDLDETIP